MKNLFYYFLIFILFVNCSTKKKLFHKRDSKNYLITSHDLHPVKLKTNGYYFHEKKIKKDEFHIKLKLKDSLIYAINPILLDSLGNISTSDHFVGVLKTPFSNDNNNFKASKKHLEKILRRDGELFTFGRFTTKKNNIKIQYYLRNIKRKSNLVEYNGLILNDSSFVLKEVVFFRFNEVKKINKYFYFQKFNFTKTIY